MHVDPEDIKSIKTEDNKVKANILSEYFSSVFTKEPEGDVPVPNDIMVQQDMPAQTVTENMVLKFLQTLKIDKSPGPDSLHPRLFKELSESIVNTLCTIFNQSLNNRKVLKQWKNENTKRSQYKSIIIKVRKTIRTIHNKILVVMVKGRQPDYFI